MQDGTDEVDLAERQFEGIVRNLSGTDRQRIRNGCLTPEEREDGKFAAALSAWNAFMKLTGGVIPGENGGIQHHPG